MNQNPKLLIVDDEEGIRNLVKMYLELENYQVEEAGDGESALALIKRNQYNLVILDIMLPRIDGWGVCKELRQIADIPVIMLTARGEEYERILGFDLGADDYVVKPFSPRELVARVKALLRRSAPPETKSTTLQAGLLTIAEDAHQVSFGDEKINLTPKEFELLLFLAKHQGRVFSREQLLEQIWGYSFFGEARTVDTHIKKIREKLGAGASYITTVWGVGYKFEALV